MRLNELITSVQQYAKDADIQTLVNAYIFAAQAHNGQMRKSGEAYLTHPLAVAMILADMKMDIDTIATGLLHDTMEDCMVTHSDLEENFGLDVADLVDGVTKIGKLQFRSKEEAQAENFRKMVLAMSNDIRVVLVKLADRLHNMRTMQHMKSDRQKAISRETMDIFAPIANRLGLSRVKSELEDLCFRYLEPDIYEQLSNNLSERSKANNEYIEQFKIKLENLLSSKGIHCTIYGRTKHLVSIYRKMEAQSIRFEQVHDLIAFRVIVHDLHECYASLGYIHGTYSHHPERRKDYIAQPKSNGYQSLHTVVIPSGEQVEGQIRTHDMHQFAEYGIAAHWRYKEGHLALSKSDVQKISKLRALFEAAKEIQDPAEFLETVKVDLFSNEIFVFTPKGDVKIFPQQATALDFAYAIHTEVGNQCTGAFANGKMVPLRYVLQNGDRISVQTSPNQTPKRAWLDIARTGRAISKIRHYIREEERLLGIELGKEILEKEALKRSTTLTKLIKTGKLREVYKPLGFKEPEHLYLSISSGATALSKVIKVLFPEEAQKTKSKISSFISKMRSKPTSAVTVGGKGNVLTSFAKCCSPLPGEPITGFITRGKGISIHRSDCPQLLHSDAFLRIEVDWEQNTETAHTTALDIVCNDQMGILADLGAVCKTQNVNVIRMDGRSGEAHRANLYLEIIIKDVSALNNLMRAIRKISGVLQVRRITTKQ